MVVINGRFLTKKTTGVVRYATEILSELDRIISPGTVIIALPPNIEKVPNYINIVSKKVGFFHNILWEQISLPWYVHKKRATSLNLCNSAPLLNPGIVCIHDVKVKARPFDFKLLFRVWYKLLFYNECKRAKKIITVSNFSKKEICKYYSVDPKRIVVIPNAWQHIERIEFDEKTLDRYKLDKGGYYFSICSLEPNKNLRWIVQIAKNNMDQIFVIAGSLNPKVFAENLRYDFPRNLKLIGYISDEEAKTLMRDCKGFLFPSFYEGFGIPPMEALAAGCTNIYVSDIEVMHELFGNHVNYIDPNIPNLCLSPCNNASREALMNYSWERISSPRLYKLLSDF